MKELLFSGDTPCVIRYEAETENYFTNLKPSSCDMLFVDDGILDQLYTSEKQSIWMQLKDGNNIIWEGYVTPNMFSQSIESNLNEISVTCIDALNILKYMPVKTLFDRWDYCTIGEILYRVLYPATVFCDNLYIESGMKYGDKSFLDLSISMNNFFTEDDESINCDEMISEILKIFNMSIFYNNNRYIIYQLSNISDEVKNFDYYLIRENELEWIDEEITLPTNILHHNDDYKFNNVSTGDMSIYTTYNSINAVSVTKEMLLDDQLFDKVSADETEKYSYDDAVIIKNTTSDGWSSETSMEHILLYNYLFNGVYYDNRYLDTHVELNGMNNINKVREYAGGEVSPERTNETGNLLTFSGITDTFGEDDKEVSPSLNAYITSYAADNGIPPELFPVDYLKYHYIYDPEEIDGHYWKIYPTTSTILKTNYGEIKRTGETPRLSYKQHYTTNILKGKRQLLNLELEYQYSRTGFPEEIERLSESFITINTNENNYQEADFNYYPTLFQPNKVRYDAVFYYDKYYPVLDIDRMTKTCDYRNVKITATTKDNTYYFTGLEWTETETTFKLFNIVNNTYPFRDKYKPTFIEVNGYEYSLDENTKGYYMDGEDRFVGYELVDGGKLITTPLLSASTKYVHSCEKGKIQIILPYDKITGEADIDIEIYTSELLGTTSKYSPIYTPDDELIVLDRKDTLLHKVKTISKRGRDNNGLWCPPCVTYFKAEHLRPNITITSLPNTVGKMFNESDIQYKLKGNLNYVEQYNDLTFTVNTYSNMYGYSFSYLIDDDEFAKPEKFSFNGLIYRPEEYVVRAYLNYYGYVRRIFNKTIVPFNVDLSFLNRMKTTEVDNTLSLLSYNWDIKSNRYTVNAVEDYNMNVGDKIPSIDMKAIPHKAKMERWNYIYRLPEDN